MSEQIDRIIIYTDGGSRGNPGPAASAFVLTDTGGTRLHARAFLIGKTTNNVAEYTAVCEALEAAKKIGAKNVMLFSDSELLIKQLNGQYKVKSENLRPLFQRASKLLGKFQSSQLQHTRRENNTEADGLLNEALDLGRDIELGPALDKPAKAPIKLGVLISGGGTTLINILDCINKGQLNAEVSVVISSRSKTSGVKRGKDAGLEVKIIRKKDHPEIDKFSKQIEKELIAADVDLVIQAGWLCLWKIPSEYENRVMNIHPALLPSFGGQGMWGHHVHEAVLKAGCKVSGCTVHFCTNEYDKGPIIVQRSCAVKDTDSGDSLAERVFEQECMAYPEAIRLFAQDRIRIKNDIVIVK